MNSIIDPLESLGLIPIWLIAIVLIWSLTWKGLALWKSARKNSPVWFIILLIVNTIGVLEILYIYVFSEMECCKKTEKRKTRRKKRR